MGCELAALDVGVALRVFHRACPCRGVCGNPPKTVETGRPSAQLTELSRLKHENSELRRTNEILRLAGSFRPGGRPDQAAALT